MITARLLDAAFTEADRSVIQQICDEAEPAIRVHLPALRSEIELELQAGPYVIQETGEVGASVSPGVVRWIVDPSRDGGVIGVARSHLRCTLFHELHHQVRGWVMEGGQQPSTFMHGVVCEGLATAFERDAAGSHPPWGDYPPEVGAWVDELVALPVHANYFEWMFQHTDGRRWIGYRAGTFIADQAIAASGLSAAQLATTPTPEILSIAGVSPGQ